MRYVRREVRRHRRCVQSRRYRGGGSQYRKPDVVVHEMTSLSAANDLRRFNQTFAVTNRLRTEGLVNLLAGAKQAGHGALWRRAFAAGPMRARRSGQIGRRSLDLEPPSAIAENPRCDPLSRKHGRGFARNRRHRPQIRRVLRPQYRSLVWADDRSVAASARAANRRRRWLVVVPGMSVDAAAAAAIKLSRAAHPAFTTSSMMSRRQCANGCLRSPRCWARSRPGAYRSGWRVSPRAKHIVTLMTEARAGSNAPRRSAISPGNRPTPSWRQGFAEVLAQNA